MIEEKLAELDAMPNVAKYLLDIGMKGFQRDPYCCPVANYLKRTTTAEGIAVSASAATSDEELHLIEMPPRVSHFIRDFDEDVYPELIGDPGV